jgi:phosphoribosylglycinamide formyltransferase 1
MAKLAVFASGWGSNFQVIAGAIENTPHEVVCLICDQKNAPVLRLADSFNIPSFHVPYKGRSRKAAELEIIPYLKTFGTELIALAGYMKILTKTIIDAFGGRIINIHPSLLPRFPGVQGIERSYNSGDKKLGITIHQVDYGLDSGPVLLQKSFSRQGNESLEDIEMKIHALEHESYSKVIIQQLDARDANKLV